MNTVEEVIDTWKKLGWDSTEKYHKALSEASTEEDRELYTTLDPDVVDPKTFWKATDIHFNTDTVCNQMLLNQSLSIEESNKTNHGIAEDSSAVAYMNIAVRSIKNKGKEVSVAEIGCGYGSFYENYIKPNDIKSYKGFDIIQRYDEAEELMGKGGCFSDFQVADCKDKFNIFYSCNVFQHLSQNQTKKYLDQVYEMLPNYGYFVLMYAQTSSGLNRTFHYGQTVQLFTLGGIEEEIVRRGFIIEAKSSLFIGGIQPTCYLLKKA